ncbi:hypothetical protein ABID70_001628 [Clavibacter michiganensis]|uniref:hypothetical protein n=1 Tax=Clavibacter michiganensis TaxID=28447 RepID=UPI001AEA3758|nr:hypothetical protein [Clavibacter michiganensis]MBP2459060.1 hypothetical protein [Clavibacter michiganensis]MDQ0411632.1 hypothetical protein [Clavibacter michiganensis]
MSDEDLMRRYEADGERLARSQLEWVPAQLHVRVVLALGGGRAYWVDAFRGYPGGIAFTAHYRWNVGDPPAADPDDWPEFAVQFPARDPVTFTADVDGRDDPRTAGAQGGHALHALGSNGLSGIATAEWWLPEVPRASLTLTFSHPSIGLAGSAVVDARGWADEIAEHSIRIE